MNKLVEKFKDEIHTYKLLLIIFLVIFVLYVLFAWMLGDESPEILKMSPKISRP